MLLMVLVPVVSALIVSTTIAVYVEGWDALSISYWSDTKSGLVLPLFVIAWETAVALAPTALVVRFYQKRVTK